MPQSDLIVPAAIDRVRWSTVEIVILVKECDPGTVAEKGDDVFSTTGNVFFLKVNVLICIKKIGFTGLIFLLSGRVYPVQRKQKLRCCKLLNRAQANSEWADHKLQQGHIRD